MDGPVVIECVVDPLEPPEPPNITATQTKHLAEAMVRGEVNRVPIGLTLGRAAWDEKFYSQSPFGVAGQVTDALLGEEKGEKKK